MLRSILHFLAQQPQLRHFMETSPTAAKLTHRFVAGRTLDEGIAVAQTLNRCRMDVALDPLGENVTTAGAAAAARDDAIQAVSRIRETGARSTLSIKLTQLGLDLGSALCRENVDPLCAAAAAAGTKIEFDMESVPYVEPTLGIVREMQERYGCVRAVIQAYLHRSEADIASLSAARIPVRLCKGAYRESARHAMQEKSAVDANYLKLARQLLETGVDPALATHDEKMIAVGTGVDPARFEYQMLYGVRRELQRELVEDGFRLRVYVPFGEAWYPYFMRRMAEKPANVLFVVRSVFGD